MPKTKAKKSYRCLVGITHDPNGKRWEAGSLLSDGDLPAQVIEEFLEMVPPVLEAVESEVDNGQSREE